MNPSLVLKEDREKSLLRRHPWIFEGAVEEEVGKPRSGATVDIISSKGEWLAKAAYSGHSQIRARVWSFDKDAIIDNTFFKNKIYRAYQLRKPWLAKTQTNAFRLVAGESDGLPGITIDVYDNVVVMQVLSAGGEKHKAKIIYAINDLFPDACVHERSDVEVRKKEGLELVVHTHIGTLPDTVIITENNVKIEVDLINGHKTGFYLDQRLNRKITGGYCKDKKVLNCFSYSGTFGVYAALNGANHVTNIDVSQLALDTGKRNLALNIDAKRNPKADTENANECGLDIAPAVADLKADVFEALRTYHKNGDKFDVIIMDPPKFIDNKRHLTRAARGYKDINRLACELLVEGGVLITFSCSGLMPSDLFNKIVADAALDANTSLSFVQRLHQDYDHMVASYFPEGYYLKGLVCIKNTPI
jgi:23S rRNA (cytosine1962-C5)-methyltransferase